MTKAELQSMYESASLELREAIQTYLNVKRFRDDMPDGQWDEMDESVGECYYSENGRLDYTEVFRDPDGFIEIVSEVMRNW